MLYVRSHGSRARGIDSGSTQESMQYNMAIANALGALDANSTCFRMHLAVDW
jgi:hypothetical protein